MVIKHQTMAECCSQQQDDSISLPIIERGVPSVAEAAMDEESEEKEEETCSSEEAADRAMPMRKIRPTPSSNDDAMGGETVGAIQINERAPQINRRFFMGLDRPGARQRRAEDRAARRAAARRGSTTPVEDQVNSNTGGQAAETLEMSGNTLLLSSSSNRHAEMNNSVESAAVQSSFIPRRISFSFINRVSRHDSTMLIEATVVEDSEIYEAKTMGFCQRYWKFIFAITVIILTTSTLVGTLVIEPPFTKAPKTSSPTLSPTFDPRPTLDIVQERGYLLCGVNLITHFQFINIVSYNSEFWRCCMSFVVVHPHFPFFLFESLSVLTNSCCNIREFKQV
jgi:hypothetical protein